MNTFDNNITLLKEMNKAVSMMESNALDSKTVTLAGKQRMLTQKMVKETLGLVQGTESIDTLKGTSILFDKTLKGLIENMTSGSEQITCATEEISSALDYGMNKVCRVVLSDSKPTLYKIYCQKSVECNPWLLIASLTLLSHSGVRGIH